MANKIKSIAAKCKGGRCRSITTNRARTKSGDPLYFGGSVPDFLRLLGVLTLANVQEHQADPLLQSPAYAPQLTNITAIAFAAHLFTAGSSSGELAIGVGRSILS